MAVIVMGLVPCLTAGVAFTAHPVTGARDQVLINASWGLGEAIVSGRVTPDYSSSWTREIIEPPPRKGAITSSSSGRA